MNMPMLHNPREIMAAGADAIALRAGVRVTAPHPLAHELSLKEVAYACGLANPPRGLDDDRAILAAGMRSMEFSRVLADGLRVATIAAYGDASEHSRYAVPVEVKNFRPTPVAVREIGTTLEPLADGAEIRRGAVLLPGDQYTAQLTTYARAMLVTRELIHSDMAEAIARGFRELGYSAARIEGRLVADALESNAAFNDGATPFGPTNAVADAFGATSFANALSLLRKQPAPDGGPAGWRARHLVVGADLEYAAQALVKESGFAIEVSVNTWLPVARWYVMADPAQCPVIATLRLPGAQAPVTVETRELPIEHDGAGVQVRADLGACLLRRTGIVRGGA